jgi:hypothetical protein
MSITTAAKALIAAIDRDAASGLISPETLDAVEKLRRALLQGETAK